MKVLICGAGQVGFGIAERLAAEGNDVSIIDSSPELVSRVTDALDVRGFVGHGSYPDVLEDAGARDAEMIIAVTFSDEVNMIACQVAHSLFEVPFTIARIRAQSYLEPHREDLFIRVNIPIDVRISPEIEVGEMVLRRLSLPGAFETVSLAEESVTMVGVSCEEDCPIVDTPLRQLTELFPDLPAVVVGVVRDGRLFVPHGDDQLLAGDDAYFVARDDQVERTLKIFGHEEQRARRVIVAGGGNIGLYVSEKLEELETGPRLKLIENDRTRATIIAEQLKRTVVLNGSALDEELLREADAGSAETMVALTNDDQINILSCVMANRLGCQRTLCLLNNVGYASILRSLGIDAFVNPRTITVSSVLRHVRRGRIKGVHAVQNGAGEIIDAEALETSPLVGQPLRELDLPPGLRIGAVWRKGEVLIPDGSTTIMAHDRVVIFALAEHVRDVERMFRVSIEFF